MGRISRAVLILVLLQGGLIPLVAAQVDTSREDQLLKTALEYIENNRKGTVQIQFVDEITGRPVGDSEIQFEQTSHDFLFSNLFSGDVNKMRWLGLEWDGDVWRGYDDLCYRCCCRPTGLEALKDPN